MNDSLDHPLDSSRREFLRKAVTTATVAGVGTSSAGVAVGTENNGRGPLKGDPFTLGVASGDPLPDSVVLWTRLAPEPLSEDGGMPDRQIPVQWEIATDEDMDDTVGKGNVKARPEYAHSVHIDVKGLDANTEYFYQFKVGPDRSPVGRTKTAPAEGADVDELRFAFTSCQHYPSGYYTAHDHLADEDLDLAVQLGDYIYEGGAQGSLNRGHEPPREIESLGDYRIREAQYKTDSNLQDAHAAFPWLVTWDDHEVENNYADATSEDSAPTQEFLERRANAYQAYFEHQPLRPSRMPNGPNLPLYRRFTFGELAEFNVLDTRQYRDDQVSSSEEAANPGRTILGDEQEDWLVDGLNDSTSRWNVLANQVPVAATDENPNPDVQDFGGGDKWDGYRADRETLLDAMAAGSDLNPVVITGDVHRNYAYNLKADFSDPDSETVGTEYVGTSATSFGDGTGATQYSPTPNEPWQRFYSDNRGYVRCTLTSGQCQTDYRVVSTVENPNASISTLASFVTEAGDPGAKQVTPSIEVTGPNTYNPGIVNNSPEPFELAATVTNPDGTDAAAVSVENVDLKVTKLPDGWATTANTTTQFNTISNGESVTGSWEVIPDGTADGDVTLGVEAVYEINGEEYRYLSTRTLSAPQIAYWQFENDNTDSSSYNHRFSLENGASYDDQVAIEGDYSLLLDGDDDYADLAECGEEFLSQTFNQRTVSMWIKPESTAGEQMLYNEGAALNGMGIRIADGTLQAVIVSNGVDVTVESVYESTEWSHVATVFDQGALRLYVNGSEVAANEDVGYESASGGYWGGELGAAEAFADWGGNFAGHIDATAIYSRALSADQISTLSDTPDQDLMSHLDA